jgi:signal transduction histidine kinase
VHRAQGRWDAALTAYGGLAGIADVTIAGAPADLQARRAACAVLQEAGRAERLSREAATLEADLLAGRWALDEAAWELTTGELAQWLGRPVSVSPEQRAFSITAASLWDQRAQVASPSRTIDADGTLMTVLTRRQGTDTLALAIVPAVIDTWAAESLATVPTAGTALSLIGSGNEVLAGLIPSPGAAAVRSLASDTGLPWTLVVSHTGGPAAATELADRRQLLSVGLAAILLLLSGGSYFAWRVMRRELAVARLQTDFVSTVSHEFRTPLTSLQHVTELLDESDDVPREKRQALYEALGRNTERLRRLVESLLDFSRMESGRRPYEMQQLDIGALAAEVVADFQEEVASRGFTVALEIERGAALEINADRSSLTSALWNLLDNAVKYSPGEPAVRVSVGHRVGMVLLSVQDSGLGIPAAEHKTVFGRFVRGAQAARLGIKGTGLGLALVSHIVRAHGGRIELESRPGVGSTFRLMFPAPRLSTSALAERRA